MAWFVYILESVNTGRLYRGCTEDPDRRLDQHNRGAVRSTKAYAPWRRIVLEEFPTKTEALQRERFLKSRSGHRVVKQLATASRDHVA